MTTARPLRADAERNRQRILAAAGELFAERGVDVSIDDIAAAAGVGVGTVYRRFADRDALIEALFEAKMAAIVQIARDALEVEDPWEAFTTVLWQGAETMAGDRALSEVFASIPGATEAVMPTVAGLTETMSELIRRAQAAGALRGDLIVDDIPMVMCGIGSATKKEHRCSEAWRRHLSLVLDGMRAPGSGPLPT